MFYKLTEMVSLGIENVLFFQSGRGGEYCSFPFVTWEAGQHAFFQVGGGYHHFESRDQFTFLLHLNFVNPSTRAGDKDGTDEASDDDPGPTASQADRDPGDSPHIGPVRRWIRRRWCDR